MAVPGERWQVADPHRIRMHGWEDGYTVFHGGSGDTHLLDSFTGEVLSCLLKQPMDLDELARTLAGQALAELEPEERAALEQALTALQRIHLAEPCPR